MKRPSFHPEADLEVIEAAQYYEARSQGLGQSFLEEIERALGEVSIVPQASPIARGTIRRKRLRKFPYNLLYAIEGSRIRVYAVAHVRRRPDYWIGRT